MTEGPIAAVAALRATSVVFATLIGEPLQAQRAAAALVILVGIVALRLG